MTPFVLSLSLYRAWATRKQLLDQCLDLQVCMCLQDHQYQKLASSPPPSLTHIHTHMHTYTHTCTHTHTHTHARMHIDVQS